MLAGHEAKEQQRYDQEVADARAKMGHLGGWYLGDGLWQLPDMQVVNVEGEGRGDVETFDEPLERLMREWNREPRLA